MTDPTPKGALRCVVVFVSVGVGLSMVFALTGWGLPCPMRGITGWLCPLCGGTHMGADLLRGDIVSAWNDNAVLLMALVLLGARTVGWVLEWVRHVRRQWLPQKIRAYALPSALAVGIAWMIMRNLM